MRKLSTPKHGRIEIKAEVTKEAAYDGSSIVSLQTQQCDLLNELYAAVSRLETALAPIANRQPTMLNSESVSNPSPSISPVADELVIRNDFIRSITSNVETITNSLTL